MNARYIYNGKLEARARTLDQKEGHKVNRRAEAGSFATGHLQNILQKRNHGRFSIVTTCLPVHNVGRRFRWPAGPPTVIRYNVGYPVLFFLPHNITINDMANTASTMTIGRRLLAAHWVWLLLVLPLAEATIGEDGFCNLFIFVPFASG
jgi:hypothetical protein